MREHEAGEGAAGLALGATLLASAGPDIPDSLRSAGTSKVELKTRERDAGIDMLLVEVYPGPCGADGHHPSLRSRKY